MGMLPNTLYASAVPRWSHRDPIEAGNPFRAADPRHVVWQAATGQARRALERFDTWLETTAQVTLDPMIYRAQLLDLAVARFDVWAKRGLSVVSSDEDLYDYRRWVGEYVGNWLRYVADTCPRVEVGDELRTRLDARAEHWTTEALRRRGRPARWIGL